MAGVVPLLKWPGGKRRLAGRIWEALLHEGRPLTQYMEPFLGSGAAFLGRPDHVHLTSAGLSDVNERLIRLHQAVAETPEALVAALDVVRRVPWPASYAAMRDCYNASGDPAILCWLNRACFNGLYRENQAGDFNVPIGSSLGPLPTRASVQSVHAALHRGVGSLTIRQASYRDALMSILAGGEDLSSLGVYLDPPYLVERSAGEGCSGFTSYSAGGFSLSDHLELVRLSHRIAERGARVVVSGCSGWVTEQVYLGAHSPFRVHEVLHVSRSISATSQGRLRASEWLLRAN